MTLIIKQPSAGRLILKNNRLWTPANITTALWLDAADASTVTLTSGAVSQWSDKSGNALHASQSNSSLRPTYASNTVNFAAQTLSVPIAAAQTIGRSLAMVFKTTGVASSNFAGFVSLMAADNPELRYGVYFNPTVGSGNAVLTYWNGGYVINGYNGLFTAGSCVFVSELNGNTSPLGNTLYKNGTSVAFASRNIVTQAAFTQFTLGGYIGLGTQNGSLNELITYTTNNLNRQLIEGYLAHKWGLAADLPSDHPYKSAAPTI